MITYITGDLLQSKSHALINTVNCVGVMGKGIALCFRRSYPDMYQRYRRVCEKRLLKPTHILPIQQGNRLILNLAVKDHWRHPSRYEWVEGCLSKFASNYERLNITSAAFPWIGAQNGQLDFNRVRNLMLQYLEPLPIPIQLYTYKGDS